MSPESVSVIRWHKRIFFDKTVNNKKKILAFDIFITEKQWELLLFQGLSIQNLTQHECWLKLG